MAILLKKLLIKEISYHAPVFNKQYYDDESQHAAGGKVGKKLFFDFYAVDHLWRSVGSGKYLESQRKYQKDLPEDDPFKNFHDLPGAKKLPVSGPAVPDAMVKFIDKIHDQVVRATARNLLTYIRMAVIQEFQYIVSRSSGWVGFRNAIVSKYNAKKTITKNEFQDLIQKYIPALVSYPDTVKRILLYSKYYSSLHTIDDKDPYDVTQGFIPTKEKEKKIHPFSNQNYNTKDKDSEHEAIKLNNHDTDLLERFGFKWIPDEMMYVRGYTTTGYSEIEKVRAFNDGEMAASLRLGDGPLIYKSGLIKNVLGFVKAEVTPSPSAKEEPILKPASDEPDPKPHAMPDAGEPDTTDYDAPAIEDPYADDASSLSTPEPTYHGKEKHLKKKKNIHEWLLLREEAINTDKIRRVNSAIQKAGITMDDIARGFSDVEWSPGGKPSYGGTNWGTAAIALLKLTEAKSSLDTEDYIHIIDYVYDLQHNTGSLLNKGPLHIDDADLNMRYRTTHPARFLPRVSPLIKQLLIAYMKYLPNTPDPELEINKEKIIQSPGKDFTLVETNWLSEHGWQYDLPYGMKILIKFVKQKTNQDPQTFRQYFHFRHHTDGKYSLYDDYHANIQIFNTFEEAKNALIAVESEKLQGTMNTSGEFVSNKQKFINSHVKTKLPPDQAKQLLDVCKMGWRDKQQNKNYKAYFSGNKRFLLNAFLDGTFLCCYEASEEYKTFTSFKDAFEYSKQETATALPYPEMEDALAHINSGESPVVASDGGGSYEFDGNQEQALKEMFIVLLPWVGITKSENGKLLVNFSETNQLYMYKSLKGNKCCISHINGVGEYEEIMVDNINELKNLITHNINRLIQGKFLGTSAKSSAPSAIINNNSSESPSSNATSPNSLTTLEQAWFQEMITKILPTTTYDYNGTSGVLRVYKSGGNLCNIFKVNGSYRIGYIDNTKKDQELIFHDPKDIDEFIKNHIFNISEKLPLKSNNLKTDNSSLTDTQLNNLKLLITKLITEYDLITSAVDHKFDFKVSNDHILRVTITDPIPVAFNIYKVVNTGIYNMDYGNKEGVIESEGFKDQSSLESFLTNNIGKILNAESIKINTFHSSNAIPDNSFKNATSQADYNVVSGPSNENIRLTVEDEKILNNIGFEFKVIDNKPWYYNKKTNSYVKFSPNNTARFLDNEANNKNPNAAPLTIELSISSMLIHLKKKYSPISSTEPSPFIGISNKPNEMPNSPSKALYNAHEGLTIAAKSLRLTVEDENRIKKLGFIPNIDKSHVCRYEGKAGQVTFYTNNMGYFYTYPNATPKLNNIVLSIEKMLTWLEENIKDEVSTDKLPPYSDSNANYTGGNGMIIRLTEPDEKWIKDYGFTPLPFGTTGVSYNSKDNHTHVYFYSNNVAFVLNDKTSPFYKGGNGGIDLNVNEGFNWIQDHFEKYTGNVLSPSPNLATNSPNSNLDGIKLGTMFEGMLTNGGFKWVAVNHVNPPNGYYNDNNGSTILVKPYPKCTLTVMDSTGKTVDTKIFNGPLTMTAYIKANYPKPPIQENSKFKKMMHSMI